MDKAETAGLPGCCAELPGCCAGLPGCCAGHGDRIELRDLRVLAVVGVLAHEREAPQPLSVDVDIYANLAAAASSDALADTLNYATAAQIAVEICETAKAELLEKLAAAVAEKLCAQPGVLAATATVRKLRPPVPLLLESAAVRVTRFAAAAQAAAPAAAQAND